MLGSHARERIAKSPAPVLYDKLEGRRDDLRLYITHLEPSQGERGPIPNKGLHDALHILAHKIVDDLLAPRSERLVVANALRMLGDFGHIVDAVRSFRESDVAIVCVKVTHVEFRMAG